MLQKTKGWRSDEGLGLNWGLTMGRISGLTGLGVNNGQDLKDLQDRVLGLAGRKQ